MKNKEICALLGIDYPIFQGGMAWVSDAELAAAVSNAGGLGIIAAGNAPKDWVVNEVRKIKGLTDKPFALNLMLLSPFIDEVVDAVIEEGVKIVVTGAGNPGKYFSKLNEHGVKIIPVVPSVAQAIRMERNDGVVAMIADECNVSEPYKEKVLKAKDTSTLTTGNSTGHPVRVIKNKFAKKFKAMEDAKADQAELEAFGAGALRKAVVDGDVDNGSVMAGQIAGLVNKRESCKDIIEDLMKGYQEVVRGLEL